MTPQTSRAYTPPADPPSWRPTPDQIAGLAGVDLILAHGAGYEAWVATALPEERLVLTAAAQANIQSETFWSRPWTT